MYDPDEKTRKVAAKMQDWSAQNIDLYLRKNPVYGDSFGRSIATYGLIAGLVRIADKFQRLEALVLGAENKVPDEKLEDTLNDLANYCYMFRWEVEERARARTRATQSSSCNIGAGTQYVPDSGSGSTTS